jgi:hypothetical protein
MPIFFSTKLKKFKLPSLNRRVASNKYYLDFKLNNKNGLCQLVDLRGYWSLELNFLDEILANQGFKDIIKISQFVDLAFSLREKYVKTFLYTHTP